MIKLKTDFAPPERETEDVLSRQSKTIENIAHLKDFTNAVPDVYLILNDKRQIVYANQALLDSISTTELNGVIGKRPGEVLDCIHANENPAGCGTSVFCETCGAVNAILTSLGGKKDVKECRIETKTGDALDLQVWTTPYDYKGETFIIFAVKDTSNEKRRKALERIFFHDILNTAGGLRGFAELIKDTDESSDNIEEFKDIIYSLSESLIEEIQAQKQLIAAENNELKAYPQEIKIFKLFADIISTYKNHQAAIDKKIKVDTSTWQGDIITDKALLKRVIGNMLKNALEASPDGETVTIGCKSNGKLVEFWVHNPSYIEKEIQLQIFQRSFSTKGIGRGLGTYSMKLLSERYLKGSIEFESNKDTGTTFSAFYPKDIDK